MIDELYRLGDLTVKPASLYLHVPPFVWKGDCVGHVGKNDLFFWVLEGECYLHIDSQSYIVRPGQMAYLPKGKMRAYTHASKRFSMYEMAFVAKSDGKELMQVLGLDEGDFVVDIPEKEKMSELFEGCARRELFQNPIYDMAWCANIINIIRIYAEQRGRTVGTDRALFKPVLEYMSENMAKSLTVEELSSIVFMQPTYFIRQFGKTYGLSPIAYFNQMKMYKAMGMLASTDVSIENIAKEIGISDTSYFARLFKKHASVTPSEYRSEFKRGRK